MSMAVNENVIEFRRNQETATVTFCQRKYITKIKKLAEKYPDECEIVAENPDGSIMAHIPTKWVKISKHKGQAADLTDEERQIIAERLKNARQNKSKTAENDSEDN